MERPRRPQASTIGARKGKLALATLSPSWMAIDADRHPDVA
jgi:hypothetical protein